MRKIRFGSRETICPVYASNYAEGRTRVDGTREGTTRKMKKDRRRLVDRLIDTARDGCAEISWSPDAGAYAITMVVVSFLLTVFVLILPTAA